MVRNFVFGAFLLLGATAAPWPYVPVYQPFSRPCQGNSPTTRSQWCNFDLKTNWYENPPDTGVVREYYFEITNITAAPDGFERIMYAVNGQVPGPAIEGNWGDTFRITVKNNLENNGTGIHWHGHRQHFSNQADGVPSVTQCPIAPGESYTYEWRATQYGTSWYHSHIKIQAWMGVFGPIIVHGPSSAYWDEDVGHVFLNDWSHMTVDALHPAELVQGPPTMETGLINGKGVWNGGGSRWQTTFNPGKKYLMRIVNAAIDSHFRFSIDGHKLTIIATDMVPIEPYTTHSLSITMGQRYDVIVEADQEPADYWIRAYPMPSCASISNTTAGDVKAILHYGSNYHSGGTADPTSSPWDTAFLDLCLDEEPSNLVPVLPLDVGPDSDNDPDELNITISIPPNPTFHWYLDGTSMQVQWEMPTLQQIFEEQDEPEWKKSDAVIELPEKDVWAYFVLETTLGITHPIHLHGHDFHILAAAANSSWSDSIPLNLKNSPRRDVAVLPANGYLVLAFKTDNPGAWLMHCHIGWHASEGFALQFVERYDEIKPLIDGQKLSETCKSWAAWQQKTGIEEEDSGV